MNYVNLTPDPIDIYAEDEKTLLMSIPPSGVVARLRELVQYQTTMDRIPFYKVTLADVDNLPERGLTDTFYILSLPLLMGMTGTLYPARPDCMYPHGQIRDKSGRIIGYTSLARLA